MSESPVHPAVMYSTCAIRLQICRKGVIYVYFRLQSGHWTHGSGQFDFKSQIQRETNRMLSIRDERVPSVSSVTVHQGYLAVTLLMHENSDFLRLVVNSIRKDLDENNEINNCLALHAIANVGGTEMAEALCEDVHRLLISPYVSSAVIPECPCPLTMTQNITEHGKEEGSSNVAQVVP